MKERVLPAGKSLGFAHACRCLSVLSCSLSEVAISSRSVEDDLHLASSRRGQTAHVHTGTRPATASLFSTASVFVALFIHVMAAAPTPHRTPLRRLSQGSLSRLSRSGAYPDAPHGLGFLEPALGELVDEVEALQTNAEGLKSLSNALATFNESFASWLYVMNMNALTTDWPQAPTEASFVLAKRRAGAF